MISSYTVFIKILEVLNASDCCMWSMALKVSTGPSYITVTIQIQNQRFFCGPKGFTSPALNISTIVRLNLKYTFPGFRIKLVKCFFDPQHYGPCGYANAAFLKLLVGSGWCHHQLGAVFDLYLAGVAVGFSLCPDFHISLPI